ncbi:MAG: hypothetical protein R3Y15_03525 [Rikenellaceae bacterium]
MILSLIILYVVTLIYLAITERFRRYSLLICMQGWILFVIALFHLHTINILDLLFVLAETIIFKAIIVPIMLMKIIRRTGINRVHPRSIAIFNSLCASLIALIVSLLITNAVPNEQINGAFFAVAIYSLLSGLMMIVFHKRIFSHLVGFLVIENGVFLFSIAVGVEMPILINLAILLDILISVLMLGIFISRIGDQMHDLSSDSLTSIKD